MQVSAAEGRLLVVATKSGATLGDEVLVICGYARISHQQSGHSLERNRLSPRHRTFSQAGLAGIGRLGKPGELWSGNHGCPMPRWGTGLRSTYSSIG
jgi:hypothetical protein